MRQGKPIKLHVVVCDGAFYVSSEDATMFEKGTALFLGPTKKTRAAAVAHAKRFFGTPREIVIDKDEEEVL